MDGTFKIPFYAKAALIFISAFALIYTLYIGKDLIVPIVYAGILAILLNPLVNYLVRKRMNRLVAISVSVLLTITIVLSSLYLLSTQLSMFTESYPQLKQKFNSTSNQFVHWLSETMNIRISKINAWTKETQTEAIDNFALGESLSEGSRVKINALVSIIAVLLGGAIWGISGMFLSIPLVAIIKVICDHIDALKPWGFLLGDVVPTGASFPFMKKKEPII